MVPYLKVSWDNVMIARAAYMRAADRRQGNAAALANVYFKELHAHRLKCRTSKLFERTRKGAGIGQLDLGYNQGPGNWSHPRIKEK